MAANVNEISKSGNSDLDTPVGSETVAPCRRKAFLWDLITIWRRNDNESNIVWLRYDISDDRPGPTWKPLMNAISWREHDRVEDFFLSVRLNVMCFHIKFYELSEIFDPKNCLKIFLPTTAQQCRSETEKN